MQKTDPRASTGLTGIFKQKDDPPQPVRVTYKLRGIYLIDVLSSALTGLALTPRLLAMLLFSEAQNTPG